jgi:hypothetical protein
VIKEREGVGKEQREKKTYEDVIVKFGRITVLYLKRMLP